jgi:hypothetical protein
MSGKRINLVIAVGTGLCLLAGNAFGKPSIARNLPARGHVIVQPHRSVVIIRPHSNVINGRSFSHRIRPGRTHHPLTIVETPYGRIIKAYPAPQVISPFGIVERTIVRVWFTSANGTRTAVELVKRGPGYIGPRGEWYREMPSRWQLRNAYGF